MIHIITAAKITYAPISGDFQEKIYMAPYSTDAWTWVKFEDLYDTLFYGQFPGQSKAVAVSLDAVNCYVLTDYFLYEINRNNPSEYTVYDHIDTFSTKITNIIFSPTGQLFLSDYYHIFTIPLPIYLIEKQMDNAMNTINDDFALDDIEFEKWEDQLLYINAYTFIDGNPIKLSYNSMTNELKEIPT